MTDVDTQSKLAECQDMIRLLTAKLTEVVAERDRLRAERSDALSVCQELYSDPNAPAALRLKAAGLALQFERPRLEPLPPPMNLVAEPAERLPLAELVRLQRARADALQHLPPGHPEYEKWVWREDYTCPALDSPGQGSDDDTGD